MSTLKYLLLLFLPGCAGPSTPLGSVWNLAPARVSPEDRSPASVSERGATLYFDPPRQNPHGRAPLKIVIDDPAGIPEDYEFWVRYQGVDVTESFLRLAKLSTPPGQHGRRLEVDLKGLTLSPGTEHQIEAGYRSPAGAVARTHFAPPLCKAFGSRAIRSTAGFAPSDDLLREIEQVSRQAGFNPTFTAALVAQESAFQPKRVSWARAVGLTQITPSAEAEIVPLFDQWPRYPGLASYPAPIIQALIASGRANSANEWRLEPVLSLRGGLLYARQLSDRWQDTPAFGKTRWSGDPEVARTQLILASYHSGFARIQTAVNRLGPRWMSSPDLKGARTYVNRIMSYCDSFQQGLPSAASPPGQLSSRGDL